MFPVHPPFIPPGEFVGAGSLWPAGRLLSPVSFIYFATNWNVLKRFWNSVLKRSFATLFHTRRFFFYEFVCGQVGSFGQFTCFLLSVSSFSLRSKHVRFLWRHVVCSFEGLNLAAIVFELQSLFECFVCVISGASSFFPSFFPSFFLCASDTSFCISFAAKSS